MSAPGRSFNWQALETWAYLDRRPKLRRPTLTAYLRQLRFAQRRYGLDVDHFTVDQGREYLAKRLRDDASPGGLYIDTKALNFLSGYLYDEQPFQKPTMPRSVPKYLTHDEAKTVLAWHDPAEPWKAAFISLELTLGLRISEAQALRTSDLDQARSRVHIRKPAKGGRIRWLPVPPEFWSPRRPLAAYLAHRRPRLDGALWVFTKGRAASIQDLKEAMVAASRATGVHVNCTIARHTVGFRLRRGGKQGGWDLLTIKDFLGHSSVKSTEIYANDPEDLERQMRRRPPRSYYQGETP